MAMAKDKVYVDRDEFMSQMLKCIGSEEWEKAFKDRPKSEASAAMSGMAFGSLYAAVHTPQLYAHYVRRTRPCNWCGECPVWTIAFEEGSELDTWPKVVAECVRRDCSCVGEDVLDGIV